MSPEASNPDSSQDTQGLDTDRHPEGVRPFTRELDADIAKQLVIPEDPSAIDPVTGNVDFPRLPLDTSSAGEAITPNTASAATENTVSIKEVSPVPRWKKVLAGVLGGTVLAGGGYAVARATGSDAAPEPRAESSATVDPSKSGETSGSPDTVTPETSGVGVPGTTLETLNVPPSAEMLAQAIKPVTVQENQTPEAAIDKLEDLVNVRDLSATIDTAGGLHESTESIALRDRIDAVLFEGGTPHFENNEATNILREAIAVAYWTAEGTGNGPKNEEPTYRKNWTVESITEVAPNTYSAALTISRDTNLEKFDPMIVDNIVDITIEKMTGEVVITQQNGNWVIRSLKMDNA
jgi:hypothetical protein